MEELDEIVCLLQKALPKLLKTPSAMRGCDVSEKEISKVTETGKLSLEMLEHLAGDCFFETFNEEFGISEEEASEIGAFLFRSGRSFSKELKERVNYLED